MLAVMEPYKEVKIHRVMRSKLIGEFGRVWPEVAQIILLHYTKKCKDFGRSTVHFRVDGLPMSVNHQYKKGKAFKTGKVTFRLDPKILDYRMRVCEALGTNRWKFSPSGTFAAVIFLESHLWLTQKREVRQMDADNRVKAILDACESAMELPDELCWTHHVFKVQSKRERTTVYLFDLGDIIEHYY
jgi:Holliday junction resolvase RusA-like endonuclease